MPHSYIIPDLISISLRLIWSQTCHRHIAAVHQLLTSRNPVYLFSSSNLPTAFVVEEESQWKVEKWKSGKLENWKNAWNMVPHEKLRIRVRKRSMYACLGLGVGNWNWGMANGNDDRRRETGRLATGED